MAVGWAAERRGFTHRRSANNRARLVPDALTFERWIGRISRFGWRHSPQLKCAIRAVLIVFRDFLLALRAGRMQVALAVGAVIEARPDHLAALGACVRERLSHQEVKNEAKPLMIKGDSVKEKGRPAAEAELDWSGVWSVEVV